ncbi:MAG TPA: sigma-70 family RNA polymerase sigma factor [Thermoguttaceae bacterium]|nr:sigma-70 family RNA polymerase sigma factor [Thermoguttaceae bacterium]
MPEPGNSIAERPTDEELARRARAGCRGSFEELVRRFQVPLVHFLRRWTTVEEAEDLTQETLLRAYENLHRYRSRWKFRTWLFTIARRLCLNLNRRRRPMSGSDLLQTLASTDEPGDAAAADDNRRRLWETAGGALAEREFTAMWLYYAEEMPVKEIAHVVGRSATAVKTMLFRSRKKLAVVLGLASTSVEKDRQPLKKDIPRPQKAELPHE